jgi:hypothetical protein
MPNLQVFDSMSIDLKHDLYLFHLALTFFMVLWHPRLALRGVDGQSFKNPDLSMPNFGRSQPGGNFGKVLKKLPRGAQIFDSLISFIILIFHVDETRTGSGTARPEVSGYL